MKKIYVLIFVVLMILSTTDYVNDALSWSIKELAVLCNDSYGLAIIAITIIFRVILLPMTIKQIKIGRANAKEMEKMQPDLEALREKMKDNKDPFEFQTQVQEIYKKHNVSPFGMMNSMLPVLMQMPIFIALYHAITANGDILNATFLGISLGQSSLVMMMAVLLLYLLQSWIQSKSMTQMKFMLLIPPIMITIPAIIVPAAASLYWVAGGIYMLMQTTVLYFINKKRK